MNKRVNNAAGPSRNKGPARHRNLIMAMWRARNKERNQQHPVIVPEPVQYVMPPKPKFSLVRKIKEFFRRKV
jgi:hypothetical protein